MLTAGPVLTSCQCNVCYEAVIHGHCWSVCINLMILRVDYSAVGGTGSDSSPAHPTLEPIPSFHRCLTEIPSNHEFFSPDSQDMPLQRNDMHRSDPEPTTTPNNELNDEEPLPINPEKSPQAQDHAPYSTEQRTARYLLRGTDHRQKDPGLHADRWGYTRRNKLRG